MAFILTGIAVGAAMGGGMAALQHKDIMQGALYGGIGGAITGGLGGIGGGTAGSLVGDTAGSSLAPVIASEYGSSIPSSMFAEGSLNGYINPVGNAASSWGNLGMQGASGLSSPAYTGLDSMGGGQGLVAPSSMANGAMPSSSTFGGGITDFLKNNKYALGAGALGGMLAQNNQTGSGQTDPGMIDPYTYSETPNPKYRGAGTAPLTQRYTAGTPYYAANGGVVAMANGGIAGLESNQAYPMSQQDHTQYSTSSQLPASAAVMNSDYDSQTDPYSGNEVVQRMAGGGSTNQAVTDYNNMLMQRAINEYVNSPPPAAMMPRSTPTAAPQAANLTPIAPAAAAAPAPAPAPASAPAPAYQQAPMDSFAQGNGGGGMANGGLMSRYSGGGISSLGSYSDGGQLLRGPGSGVDDQIPATIGGHQPARLANNEFVVPARVVSEIGNGSTDAGAKKLYEMMNRVQAKRAKTIGKGNVAVDSGAHKELNRL